VICPITILKIKPSLVLKYLACQQSSAQQLLTRAKIALISSSGSNEPPVAQITLTGDPENMEAQAARHYWPALMAAGFRRERAAVDANSYLNYGYTVLRAATARAVCGTGLHPALGLHHGSRVNPFALVDDLMEPFRPLVDAIARDLAEADGAQIANLDPDRKRRLAAVLQQDLITKIGSSPLINCLGRLAQSLATSLAAKKDLLDLAQIVPSNRLL
jgi:CRISPR-associated protein Cas1